MSPPTANAAAGRAHGRRRWLTLLGLAAAFALFGVATVELFQLRFETGDVYPPYSTLRSDPLGAAAFYEALEGQRGLRVERNLRGLERLGQGPVGILGRRTAGTNGSRAALVCFFLGEDPYSGWPVAMDKPDLERLEEIMRTGGRVVMTFLPGKVPLTVEGLEHGRDLGLDATPSPFPSPSSSPKHDPEQEKKEAERRARDEQARAEYERRDLIKRWGLDFSRLDRKKDRRANSSSTPTPPPARFTLPRLPGESPAPTVAIAAAKAALPVPGGALAEAGEAPWHTALDFDVETPAARAAGWHALYTREGKPVIVARPYGLRGGELMLASDSYFLSNEALEQEPNPALLAGLVGDRRWIIFDESRHGLEENPGLMTLARRYGLQGALAAVGLLVGLFIWRSVVSLVPPSPAAEDAWAGSGSVAGRDAAAGFLNLLKRGVPPRELLGACLAQWQGGVGGRVPEAAAVARVRAAAETEAARPAGQRSPAAAYRAMCAAVRVRR